MNVVYALTRNYYHKLKPSLTSLRKFNPNAKVVVLAEDDEIGYDDVTVINVSGQKYFPENGVNYYNSFTYINLLKVCYPSILSSLSKVIHLDVDTIICGSLEGMWKTKLTGKWVAAVPEYKGVYKPFGDKYYNMGVAVINLSQMRKDNIQPHMVQYLNTVPQPYADQDAWNKYGLEQDKFVDLDIKYNECFCCGKTEEPVIVHYCGASHWYEDPGTERYSYLKPYM